jgi:hypothetical protein
MKIRSGFVSNSSSSSFCVHGAHIDSDEIMDLINSIGSAFPESKQISELVTKCKVEYEDGSLFEHGNLDKLLNQIFEKTQIEFILNWECEAIWLGRSYETLKDDETGAQFKASAESEIRKYLPHATIEFINEEVGY